MLDAKEKLLISSNPSSWMAACFAQFYNKHSEERICFQFYSASVEEIIRRICSYRDEIGFVYITKSQSTAFQYALEKKQLVFIPQYFMVEIGMDNNPHRGLLRFYA